MMKNLRKRWVVWLGIAVLLAILACLLAYSLSKYKPPVTNPTPGKIAFVRGSAEIYTVDSDGTNLIQLTDHDNAWGPIWSPDGTHLVFISSPMSQNSNQEYDQDIYVMESDGSNQVNVSNLPTRDDFPVWSPDSTHVAFRNRISEQGDDGELYVVDRDGSNLIRLFDQVNFFYDEVAWSPDGARITFESGGEIYVVDRDGSNLVNLTDHPAGDGNFAWSPDGSRIAFTSGRDGRDGVYIMSSDGSNPTFLMSGGFDSWSPDGSRIYFWNDGLYVMNSDGLDPALISKDAQPGLWSPDHAYLAYQVLTLNLIDYGEYSVFVMRSDGSRKIRLAKQAGSISPYDWSPDGQYIVYSEYAETSGGDSSRQVFIASPDGTRKSRLTNHYGTDRNSVWQPRVP